MLADKLKGNTELAGKGKEGKENKTPTKKLLDEKIETKIGDLVKAGERMADKILKSQKQMNHFRRNRDNIGLAITVATALDGTYKLKALLEFSKKQIRHDTTYSDDSDYMFPPL